VGSLLSLFSVSFSPSQLGGIFTRGTDGSIMTREASGHFWQNWTPTMREQFINYMKSLKIMINHEEGP